MALELRNVQSRKVCGQRLTSLSSHRRLDLRRDEKASAATEYLLLPRALLLRCVQRSCELSRIRQMGST